MTLPQQARGFDTNHASRRIYLAGPDVFFSDYPQRKRALKALCAAAGLQALCPADDEIVAAAAGVAVSASTPASATTATATPSAGMLSSAEIYAQNIALIDSAALVMANVRNFRGHEPDSGTVFEIGYAIGKGKKVWCYNVPATNLVEQMAAVGIGPGLDADGHTVEDFGLARNLMIAHACTLIVGDAAACIAAIREWLAAREAAGEQQ